MVLGLCSHGFVLGLGRDGLTWSLGLSLVGNQHEAATQEIKACPAIHVALEHLQPVDMARHGTRTPGQRHTRFDRCIVTLETFCYAPKRGQRARRCLLQPRLEPLWLPGPEQPRKVL